MMIIWVRSMACLLARIIVLNGFIAQCGTEAFKLYSSPVLGFVRHGARIKSFQSRQFSNIRLPVPRRGLSKAYTFNPVKSFFDTLLSVPKLIFGQRKQAREDFRTADLQDFELDREKQWHREEQDELENWHYWTSEQRRLHEEKEAKAKQKLQWPEVVERCVIEPLRRERLQHSEPLVTSPSTAPTLSTGEVENQKSGSSNISNIIQDTCAKENVMNQEGISVPKPQGRSSPFPWSSEEEALLVDLVQQHTIAPHFTTKQKLAQWTQPYVDWVSVSRTLHRTALKCKTKWRILRDRHAKRGKFSAQEDALIRQRVADWYRVPENATYSIQLNAYTEDSNSNVMSGDAKVKRGLWATLDRELNRRAGSVVRHWRRLQYGTT